VFFFFFILIRLLFFVVFKLNFDYYNTVYMAVGSFNFKVFMILGVKEVTVACF